MEPLDRGLAPRTPAQRERRARILAAATELLEQRDHDRIQMRHVAEAAGVALGTLYRYFPSKELLYAHVLLAWSASFGPAEPKGPRPAVTDADRLRSTLRSAVRAYERRPTFYRLLAALDDVTDPAVREVYGRFATGFDDVVRRSLPETHDDDVGVVAMASSAVLGTLLRRWSHGTCSMRQVHADLDRFVDVVFAAPAPADRAAGRRAG